MWQPISLQPPPPLGLGDDGQIQLPSQGLVKSAPWPALLAVKKKLWHRFPRTFRQVWEGAQASNFCLQNQVKMGRRNGSGGPTGCLEAGAYPAGPALRVVACLPIMWRQLGRYTLLQAFGPQRSASPQFAGHSFREIRDLCAAVDEWHPKP